jgi:hypothetical protein
MRQYGSRGLKVFLEVEIESSVRPNIRFASSTLECIDHLIHTDASNPITQSDICHKLTVTHHILPTLVSFLLKVHKFTHDLCSSPKKDKNHTPSTPKDKGHKTTIRSITGTKRRINSKVKSPQTQSCV